MDLNLKDKTVVVTGAGRGIGRAVALAFAREGASVAVNDIDEEAAREVVRQIQAGGVRALTAVADVSRVEQVEEMVSRVQAELGAIHVLVNNAGIVYEEGGPAQRKSFAQSSVEVWRREIDLILFGTLNCTKAVIGGMMERKYGRIVNMSSDFGRTGVTAPGFSTYSAAKGGVIAFTRSIAAEMGRYGIAANAVAPGLIRTTRIEQMEELKETRPEEYEVYKSKERNRLAAIPLGRLGEPEDVAGLAVFLASDAAGWITGQTFSINGGEIMI